MTGPLALHWDKVSNGERGKGWRDHLNDLLTLPFCSPLRLNQAGDLPHSNGRLSRRYLLQLITAVRLRKLQAWTYTHHDPTKGENAALLRRAFRSGLTVNISTESAEAADRAIAASLPTGADVPGVRPFRAAPGKPFAAVKAHLKLGGQELTLPVKRNAKSVTFKLKLKPGRDELWAKFTNAEGVPMGAFYSYVTKIE